MIIGFTDYPDMKPEIMGRGSLEYFFPTTSSGIFSIRGFYSGGYIGGQGLDGSETYPSTFRATTVNAAAVCHIHSLSRKQFFRLFFLELHINGLIRRMLLIIHFLMQADPLKGLMLTIMLRQA
jgi:hypothetical protein